jgi:hypothetical protein
MKIWVDDVRPMPKGYKWCFTVMDTIGLIEWVEEGCGEKPCKEIELIDLDYDAGDYAGYGGDYIEILNWLEETGRNYPIRIHSANPVGVANMRRIIERNGWTEVK